EKHSRENIFSKVKMLEKNKRIIAQKGAFFNFDKIVTIENDEIFKIPLVRIKLNYNLKNIENISAVIQDKETKIKLNKKIEELEEEFEKINTKIIRNRKK
ncbi:FRG domain-containing protein, partial [Staphylococcus hominis]|nr:FRG domain-containing protein [Staphylococcus hominis]